MIAMEELQAALPHVTSAPKDLSRAEILMFRPGRNLREEREELTLTRANGIPGERWLTEPWVRLEDGSPHPGIQVSLLSSRVHDLVRPDRENMLHPGDPVIADLDTSEANLPVGSILQIGTARIQVSDVFNDACAKWKVRYGTDAYNWVNVAENLPLRLRGILCAVLEDGVVRRGDEIRVLSR